MVTSKQAGYCPACFKNYQDCRRLDENGNCIIHGGQFGQTMDVSKTKQKLAGLSVLGGAIALLFTKRR